MAQASRRLGASVAPASRLRVEAAARLTGRRVSFTLRFRRLDPFDPQVAPNWTDPGSSGLPSTFEVDPPASIWPRVFFAYVQAIPARSSGLSAAEQPVVILAPRTKAEGPNPRLSKERDRIPSGSVPRSDGHPIHPSKSAPYWFKIVVSGSLAHSCPSPHSIVRAPKTLWRRPPIHRGSSSPGPQQFSFWHSSSPPWERFRLFSGWGPAVLSVGENIFHFSLDSFLGFR